MINSFPQMYEEYRGFPLVLRILGEMKRLPLDELHARKIAARTKMKRLVGFSSLTEDGKKQLTEAVITLAAARKVIDHDKIETVENGILEIVRKHTGEWHALLHPDFPYTNEFYANPETVERVLRRHALIMERKRVLLEEIRAASQADYDGLLPLFAELNKALKYGAEDERDERSELELINRCIDRVGDPKRFLG
jgi:hypothetical protein